MVFFVVGDGCDVGWINEPIDEMVELVVCNWKFISAISGCLRFSSGELV